MQKFIFILGPRCCGSRLDVKQMVASPEFRRFGSGGSFFVEIEIPVQLCFGGEAWVDSRRAGED